MSIRLRLALRCGLIFCLAISLTSLLGYAFHVRGHYDDLDRILLENVTHAASEVNDSTTSLEQLSQANETGGIEVVFRLYNAAGVLQESQLISLPVLRPQDVLGNPTGPAFDVLAGLAPPMAAPPTPAEGAFGLLNTPQQRWRNFILPVHPNGKLTGYIEALTPLGRLDASIQSFRDVLLALWAFGMVAMSLGLWVVASNALRPVIKMVQTAQAIALSHDFSRRIDPPAYHDELGQLADTFNDMLKSLEDAYRLQQRFISDASHELRAPLTVVQGNLELLRRQPTLPEPERQTALTEAEREAGRMARMVGDLLTLARADAGIASKQQPVELDAVVLDAFHAARQLARGQELKLEPFEPISVEGDEDRLKQLLLILLDNALKYTSEQGQVTLGLRRIETGAEILVNDTGVGITAEDLPHVFERFYRADPARNRHSGGSGLGLSIAWWIVEQHHGQIALQSEPGQGTRVTIALPLHLIRPLPQKSIN